MKLETGWKITHTKRKSKSKSFDAEQFSTQPRDAIRKLDKYNFYFVSSQAFEK